MLQQFLNYLYANDQQVWALVGGILLAWACTQRLKFLVPKDWSYHAREVSTQSIAFFAGFLATFVLWGDKRGGLTAALIVGLLNPAAWSVLMLFVGWRYPKLKELLSQDVRKGEKLSPPGEVKP